jgi:hypothetical protein
VSSPVVAAAAAVRANVGALVEALTRPRPQPPPDLRPWPQPPPPDLRPWPQPPPPDLRPWPQPPPPDLRPWPQPPASVDLDLVPEVPTDDVTAARADLENAEQGVRDVIRRMGGVPDDEVLNVVPTIDEVIHSDGGLIEVRQAIEELTLTLRDMQDELAIEDVKSDIVSQALSPDVRTASESRRSPSQSRFSRSPSAASERVELLFAELEKEVEANKQLSAELERRGTVNEILTSELERETEQRSQAQAMLLDALQALHNLRRNSRWGGFDSPPPSDNLGLWPRDSTPASDSTAYTVTSPFSIASRDERDEEIRSLVDGIFGQIEETAAALTAAPRKGRSAGAAALVPVTRTGESPKLIALRENRRRLLVEAGQASNIASSSTFNAQDREANQMVVAQHMQVIGEIEDAIIEEQLNPQAEYPSPYVTPVQQPLRRGRSAGSEGLVPGGDWTRKSKAALKEERAQKMEVLQAAIEHTNSPEYNPPLVRKEADAEVIGAMMAEIKDLQAQIEEAENPDKTFDLQWENVGGWV